MGAVVLTTHIVRTQFEPAVRFFVMGAEKWHAASAWPPPQCTDVTLCLQDECGLGSQPTPTALTASFTVDHAASTPLSSRDLFSVPFRSNLSLCILDLLLVFSSLQTLYQLPGPAVSTPLNYLHQSAVI